jgi:glycosyltransferase involved in cell wall biosynthesis
LELIINIIVPNFNKGKYIERCILSIINQTFKNWHLILVDDASIDNSKNILKKFSTNKKITFIYLKKNKGPSFCRNLGLRKSSSKYIAFLDSDDFWSLNKLEEQVSFMESRNFDMTYTDYLTIKEENEEKILKKTSISNNFNYISFLKDNSINTSTLIIKKNIIGNIKFKKTSLLEDYIFKCEILKKGVIAHKLDKVLATYRVTPSNRSSNIFYNFLNLFFLNKKFNNLNFFFNIYCILSTSIRSIKKYGLKKYF